MTLLWSRVFRLTARLVVVTIATIFSGVDILAQVPIVQPGAPGEPSRRISAEEASNLASLEFTAADVMFMQGMISHHAQALEMTVLVETRSNREAMELMAERITLSQEDEIAMMQGWLRDRALVVPDVETHHAAEFELMPGMLTVEELAQLEQAEQFAFDTLFLELMIEHHAGAVTMVENLLDQPGSAQDSLLFAFTSDVTADQSSEIDRMNAMLRGFSPDPRVNLSAGFDDAGQASLNM